MIQMLRKKYNLDIDFFGWFKRPKNIQFSYEQGSLRDLLELSLEIKNGKGAREWIFNFLMKKTKQSDRLTRKIFDQTADFEIVKLSDFILKTYAKDFFEEKMIPKNRIKVDKGLDTSYAYICLILEKTSETMESLLDSTWEQVQYMVDGIIWNLNSQTKKGQKINDRKKREGIYNSRNSIAEDLKIAKELERKIEAKKVK